MHIAILEGDMVACLQNESTCIFLDTWNPYHCELETLSHLLLTLTYPWVPQNVKLHKYADYMPEEVEMRRVYSVANIQSNLTFKFLDFKNFIELHCFCEIKVFPRDTPGEDNVLINIGEVSHITIESIKVTKINPSS